MRLKTDRSEGIEGPHCGLPLGPGVVTGENFVEKATAFMRISGRTNGEHPVIKSDRDQVAWCAWISYLRQIDQKVAFAERNGIMTVPATFPWDFTADADRLRDEEFERHYGNVSAPIISPDRRKQLADIVRDQQPRNLNRAGYKPKRRNFQMPSSFDDERDSYADLPITASPSLQASLGKGRGT